MYLTGIFLFFLIIIGGPIAYKILSIPATCFDGKQNQGETAKDKGGPCVLLDERYLQPQSIAWARSFRVRDGSYNAVAYIRNPNVSAGVESVPYHFSLYDAQNILVAERMGTTYIMPGGITPVIETGIPTGNRSAVHTYFEFTDSLAWKQMKNISSAITISNMTVTNMESEPRVSAVARNTSVETLHNVSFVAVVFDPSGNAFQTSSTIVDTLPPDASTPITFTWPDSFPAVVGHVDIIPIVAPKIVSPQTSGR
jgi:hypothetical protein